ncbi:MAG: hypothetical protein IPL83_06330 [Bdellovibrionales bacterium]|nr:hypothetical protein [Bdellovibrionales bacterium]
MVFQFLGFKAALTNSVGRPFPEGSGFCLPGELRFDLRSLSKINGHSHAAVPSCPFSWRDLNCQKVMADRIRLHKDRALVATNEIDRPLAIQSSQGPFEL